MSEFPTPVVPVQGHKANRHRRYMLADLHLFHEKVWNLRGVSMEDPQEHLDLVRSRVLALPPGSTLYLLGDITSGSAGALNKALPFLRSLAEHVHLVLVNGNHEPWHPGHDRSPQARRRWAAELAATFWDVTESVSFSVPDVTAFDGHRRVLLSHFPYEGDHTEVDRMGQWRLPDLGAWLIHGHTHQAEPTVSHRPRQVCVSWESWPEHIPSLEELVERLVQARDVLRAGPEYDADLAERLADALGSDQDELLGRLENDLVDGPLGSVRLDHLLAAASPLFLEHGRYEHLAQPDGTVRLVLGTGGWSECEQALSLFERVRPLQWRFSQQSWMRGGGYEMHLNPAVLEVLDS